MSLVDIFAGKVVSKMNASILPEMRLESCSRKFKRYSNLVAVFMFISPIGLSLLYSLLDLSSRSTQSWINGMATVCVICIGVFLWFLQLVYDKANAMLQEPEKHLREDYDFFMSTAMTMFDKVKEGDTSLESLANVCASGIVSSCQHRSNGSRGFAVYLYEYDKVNKTVQLIGASQDGAVSRLLDNPLFAYGLSRPLYIEDPRIRDCYFSYCLRENEKNGSEQPDAPKRYILSTWEEMLKYYHWTGWANLDKNSYLKARDKESCRHAQFLYNQYMAIPIMNTDTNISGLIEIIAYFDAVIDSPEILQKEYAKISGVYRRMVGVVYEIADIKEEVYQ